MVGSAFPGTHVTTVREVDDRSWPFVISVIPPDPTEEFFRPYFAKQMEILERKQRWVHLVDVRPVIKLPDAKVRNLIAENTKRMDPLTAKYNVGTALVMKSSLARGVLTAIHWLSPPAYRFATVATPQQGVEFLHECLSRAGLPVPPGMGSEMVDVVAERVLKAQGDRR